MLTTQTHSMELSLNEGNKMISINSSKIPDLADLLKRPCLHSSGYTPDSSFRFAILQRDRSFPIPDSLFLHYNAMQNQCFQGLFPDIGRAWITIDHKLFLWNYEQGQEYLVYEDQDQVIINVALVKPIPEIFINQIEFVLVISTPLEIILLGLSFGKPSTPNEPYYKRDITLYNTNMSVSCENINMTFIKGTDTGRIFMTGSNGHLYELEYRAEETFFTRKCQLVNRSARIPYIIEHLFTPSFLNIVSNGIFFLFSSFGSNRYRSIKKYSLHVI